MATVDVTVRGGGIFGLATAWACLSRGARVRLVETQAIGAGASGGLVGALVPHAPGDDWTPLKAFQLDSLLKAGDWWAEVADASGQDPGYARTGRLQPLADDAAVARARARTAAADALWLGAEWQVCAPEAGLPLAPVSATGLVVRDTLSARLHPRRALSALAAAIRARGGEIVEGADAADRGAVIHATGWRGLRAPGAPGGGPSGTGVKGQALSLAYEAMAAPQVSGPGLHIVPHADGTVAIGSTSERDFDDPFTTDAALDALLARAVSVCPDLARAPVVARWAGVRPRAKSRAPVLGPWPGRPGHYVANGGFKIGFGIAPGVGEVLAELVLAGRDAIPPGLRVEDSL